MTEHGSREFLGGYMDRFSKDSVRQTNWFLSVEDARQKIEQWRQDYNEYRPHSSLGYQTPSECATDQGTLTPAC